MFSRTLPTTLFQIFCEMFPDARVIVKSIIDQHDNFQRTLRYGWVIFTSTIPTLAVLVCRTDITAVLYNLCLRVHQNIVAQVYVIFDINFGIKNDITKYLRGVFGSDVVNISPNISQLCFLLKDFVKMFNLYAAGCYFCYTR